MMMESEERSMTPTDKFFEYAGDLAAILDPSNKSDVKSLPVGPDNDLRHKILQINTVFTLTAPASGNFILVSFTGAPLNKILEQYDDDGAGNFVHNQTVTFSVDPKVNHTWGRIIKNVLSLQSGYLVTSGGTISAGTQGDISAAQIPDGLSQMYLPATPPPQCINYSTISQLTTSDSQKLLACRSADGIGLISPTTPEQPFVRLADPVGGSSADTNDDNVDWTDAVAVTGVEPFIGIPASLSLASNASIQYETISYSIDAPYHLEVGGNFTGGALITPVDITGEGNTVTVEYGAILYDVTRNVPLDTVVLKIDSIYVPVGTYTSGQPIAYATSGDGRKIWPTASGFETHNTLTAVKYYFKLTNKNGPGAMFFDFTETPSLFPSWGVDAKCLIPLYSYQGFAQRGTIFCGKNFSNAAPISGVSRITLEVVPDKNLSQIVGTYDRNKSAKLARALNAVLEAKQKYGIGLFFKSTAVNDPDSLVALSHEIRMVIKMVLFNKFYRSQHAACHLVDSYKNAPMLNGQPAFSNGFGKMWGKFNRKVISPIGKVIKPLANEAYKDVKNIGKGLADEAGQLIRTESGNVVRSAADQAMQMAMMASGASFASGARFATTFGSQQNQVLKKQMEKVIIPDKTENKRKLFRISNNVPGMFVPACTFTANKTYPPNASIFYLTYATKEIRDEFEKIKPKDEKWSRSRGFTIYGHVGQEFKSIESGDLCILTPVNLDGESVTCAVEEVGGGDSLGASLSIFRAARQRLNIAVSGAILGPNIGELDPLVSIWKQQVCAANGLIFLANCAKADVRVTTINQLYKIIETLQSKVIVYDRPMFMADTPQDQPNNNSHKATNYGKHSSNQQRQENGYQGGGRGRGGGGRGRGGNGGVRNNGYDKTPKFEGNRGKNAKVRKPLDEYVYSPDTFQLTLRQTASNKVMPKGRLMPYVAPVMIPVGTVKVETSEETNITSGGTLYNNHGSAIVWTNMVDKAWKTFYDVVNASKYHNVPIKVLVQVWIRFLLGLGLFIHCGFGYAEGKNQKNFEITIQECLKEVQDAWVKLSGAK
jgi:hypothetical protein